MHNEELLIHLIEKADFIRNELKEYRSRNQLNHISEAGVEINKKPQSKRAKLSLTTKNALRELMKEDMNQRNLSKKLNITAQAMSEIAKKLEQNGYINRTNNKINNENILSLTDKGIEKATMFDQNIKVTSEKVFTGLSEEEKLVLLELINKI